MSGEAEAANRLQSRLTNPFLVLELSPDCRRDEGERQGAKLLAMLAAGIPEAANYPSPLGPQPRTADLVRSALAELRDPELRIVHEWWRRGLGP